MPGDIALAGFDDIPMARYVSPPLTTMRVDNAGIVRQHAAYLLACLANEKPVDPPPLDVQLMLRDSTAAAKR